MRAEGLASKQLRPRMAIWSWNKAKIELAWSNTQGRAGHSVVYRLMVGEMSDHQRQQVGWVVC